MVEQYGDKKKLEWNGRQNRIMTKTDGSWSEWQNSIMLRQKKMRVQQMVEQELDKKKDRTKKMYF